MGLIEEVFSKEAADPKSSVSKSAEDPKKQSLRRYRTFSGSELD